MKDEDIHGAHDEHKEAHMEEPNHTLHDAHVGHPWQEPEKESSYSRHAGPDVADFRRRFWVSLIITIPILILSPSIQEFTGVGQALRFPGDLCHVYRRFNLPSSSRTFYRTRAASSHGQSP
jgi:Cu2+-exporting ATPase